MRSGWARDNLHILLPLALSLVLAALLLHGLHTAERAARAESLRVAEDCVRQAVLSCYAAEGCYPESFDYLKERWGVRIDESRYLVHYEVFASNIYPDITVLERGATE